jgi:hypothetical protein
LLTEPILVTLQVVEALEDLEIPYFVAGSLATAVHGMARATMDVDLVAQLKPNQIEPLLIALGDAFFADEHMIRNALRQGLSFNLIHKKTIFKVDIFPARDQAYDRPNSSAVQPIPWQKNLINQPMWPVWLGLSDLLARAFKQIK